MSWKFPLLRCIPMALLALWGLVGCNLTASSTDSGVSTPIGVLTLKSADDCAAYERYIADALFEEVKRTPRFNPEPFFTDTATSGSAANFSFSSTDSTAPTYVSQTNTQEAGVDEADVVEAGADGVLYQIRYGVLHILKGMPPSGLAEIGSLDLGMNVDEIYLDDENKRVVAIGRQFLGIALSQPAPGASAATTTPTRYISSPRMEVFFIDVADPSAPALTKQLSVEGTFLSSRRIGNRVHLVSNYRRVWPAALESDTAFHDLLLRYWQIKWPQGTAHIPNNTRNREIAMLLDQIRARIDAVVETAGPQALVPATEWVSGANRSDAALLTCGKILLPTVMMDPSLLTITSVDTDGANAAASALVNSAWQVYASPTKLYVAQSSGTWWWDDNQRQQTAIYEFDIASGTPVYRATGRVDGWTRDAYSFSDYGGNLRVVTTENSVDSATGRVSPRHALRVLKDESAGTLEQVGVVDGFGAGESIFAVRFMGDKGYVVTFRRIDPLFAFDLSNPANPRLAGEVEIPGFSTYMHPLGEDHLLTVGRGGTTAGATNGVQLQIFDVSDLANPRSIFSYGLDTGVDGYSWSAAAYDPHAFTYYDEKGLLAIPLTVWDHTPGKTFSGIVVLHVDVQDGIVELGRVDHSDLAYQSYCSDMPASDDWRYPYCQQGGDIWWSFPRRSVFMSDATDDYLFSISDAGVKATLAQDPATVLGSLLYPRWVPRPVPLGIAVQ